MTKEAVILSVSDTLGTSRAEAAKAVDAVTLAIRDTVHTGRDVRLAPLGTFKLVHKAERTGRNPATGERLTIPAHDKITFKQSKV